MNLRTDSHPFFFSRHGQSEYNDLGRIGGDSGLTEHGLNYAKKLEEFVDHKVTNYLDKDGNPTGDEHPARLWTSTMRRTKETAQFIRHNMLIVKDQGVDDDDELPVVRYEFTNMRNREWYHLDELFAGSCDGLTYEEIEQQFPEEWERRSNDKLAYRFVYVMIVNHFHCPRAHPIHTLSLCTTTYTQIPTRRKLPRCDCPTGAHHHRDGAAHGASSHRCTSRHSAHNICLLHGLLTRRSPIPVDPAQHCD